MSRIGKLPIDITDGVKFNYDNSQVVIKGPKGELRKHIDFKGDIVTEDDKIKVINESDSKESKAIHGLIRSLINNMVVGVTKGFSKTLKIVGVGYKAQLNNNTLIINIGYSHPIEYSIPEGIKIDVPDQNTIIVAGINKQLVGQVASDIRRFKKPEPYKGKGIMYIDEKIRRKAGKSVSK